MKAEELAVSQKINCWRTIAIFTTNHAMPEEDPSSFP
jgi:hypothetical protein